MKDWGGCICRGMSRTAAFFQYDGIARLHGVNRERSGIDARCSRGDWWPMWGREVLRKSEVLLVSA